MSSQKRKSQIGQETSGDEEKLVLTIEIPKAFAAEFKANLARVTQAATKVVLDLITAQDPLQILGVEPDLAKKIFGYLDQRSLAEARKVSESWKDYVDNETSYLKDLALEASQLESLSQAVGRASWQRPAETWQVPDSRLDLVEYMIENEQSKCDFKKALELAAKNDQIDIVKQLLLSMKAEDVKSSNVLHSLSKGTEAYFSPIRSNFLNSRNSLHPALCMFLNATQENSRISLKLRYYKRPQ